jgi:Fe-S cluster assembly iron-binding protein IscA
MAYSDKVIDHYENPRNVGKLEIDYIKQGLNEGFEFNNPMEKDRCGCGESFRI